MEIPLTFFMEMQVGVAPGLLAVLFHKYFPDTFTFLKPPCCVFFKDFVLQTVASDLIDIAATKEEFCTDGQGLHSPGIQCVRSAAGLRKKFLKKCGEQNIKFQIFGQIGNMSLQYATCCEILSSLGFNTS